MNYKKIYDLISKYKDEIDHLEECRASANDKSHYDEAEYFLGCINSYEYVIGDLEKIVNDEFAALELLVHEHRAEQVLSNYEASGV